MTEHLCLKLVDAINCILVSYLIKVNWGIGMRQFALMACSLLNGLNWKHRFH